MFSWIHNEKSTKSAQSDVTLFACSVWPRHEVFFLLVLALCVCVCTLSLTTELRGGGAHWGQVFQSQFPGSAKVNQLQHWVLNTSQEKILRLWGEGRGYQEVKLYNFSGNVDLHTKMIFAFTYTHHTLWTYGLSLAECFGKKRKTVFFVLMI